ncbi:MBL fold metallo-hydrolase [Microbacterium sp. T32]|uniref:MBL fold metallo-hydrolase n=1 Tax=Microbacterium sp. T32 TaxID=1776083 RepID=UPI000B214EBB
MSPPRADEIEVSIFGPGRGEAIVVHLGGGRWLTVDSCYDERAGLHPALDYLERLGVDVATQVVLVVATHAHDDHTAGVGDIYAAAKAAKFVTSAAFTSSEFFAAVAADASIEDQLVPSVRHEYKTVLDEVMRRGRAGAPHLLRASEQKVLLEVAATGSAPGFKVTALSPSDEAQNRSVRAIAEGSAREDMRVRLAAPDPNEYTVALWVEVADVALLLGGDLLNGPTACGWRRVHESHTPERRARLIKVAHHGSQSSHWGPVWMDFLEPDVLAVLTPFRLGAERSVPKQRDIDRIVKASGRAFITARPQKPTPPKDVKETRALLQTIATNVRERDGSPGHVQARMCPEETVWRVGAASPAYELK